MNVNANKIFGFIIIFAVLAALVVLYIFNPLEAGFYPRCPSKVLTGYDCAGCGSLRCTHALLHGHFLQAWHFNPAAIITLFVIPVILFAEMFRKKEIARKMPASLVRLSRQLSKVTRHPAFSLSIFIAFLSWTIIRNFINY